MKNVGYVLSSTAERKLYIAEKIPKLDGVFGRGPKILY